MLPFFALLFALYFNLVYYVTMFKNREELLAHIVVNNIRYNKYDFKFLNNLSLLIVRNEYITTNQNELFEKLILKYKKQLKQQGLHSEKLLELKWQTKVVNSGVEFTEAYVKVVGDKLELRLPFNKNLINEIHEYVQEIFLGTNDLIWVKPKKCYVGTLNTFNLKLIYDIVPKYYKTNYCTELQPVISQLGMINAKIFDPTYVKINGNFYILACNQNLLNSIQHIIFDDNPNTLYKLSMYGIKIDDTVMDNDRFLNFAGKIEHEFDLDELEDLVNYCVELGIHDMYVPNTINSMDDVRMELNKYKNKINIHVLRSLQLFTFTSEKPGIILRMRASKGSSLFENIQHKVVTLLNSRPIKL